MGRKRVRTDSKFQSEKCAKRCLADDDRISRLPDDILVDILSFLPLKESARTSVLSFRWLNLWKHTSCLNFDAKTALDKITMDKRLRSAERRKYIKWVNDVLQSHEADTLRELRIHFDLNVSARKAINQWLAYAFSRQVERLELDLSSYNEVFSSRRPISYAFPEELLSGSTSPLQTHPKTCSIHHPLVDFKSLKALSLKCVDVTDDAIEFFLRNCPVLEQLIVHDSKEISNVEICGSSLVLKHLEISYCDNLKSIKVSAPNLTSLEVTIAEGLLLLENVPMLVEVSVTRWLGDLLPTLSCCISQLEILTLLLNEPKKSMVFPEMPKLKKLVIECGVSGDESLIGLTSLIRASPYLEEFVLKLHWFSLSSSDSEVKNTIRFPHRHLKVIKLSGYYGCGSDAELMKYFLENCVVLEKVIIDNEDGTARNLMKQQLEAQVPPHIELVFV